MTLPRPQAARPRSAPDAPLGEATAFHGLPEPVTRWRLAAALRGAARRLDLTASMLALLEHYIDVTWDTDWRAGSEPVVIRPLFEIAEHLGKSERQIRNLERALAERGLLTWRDSGNRHRKGRRDRASGALLWAYGPSLAPLGRRAEEIIALAAAARRELAENRRLRLSISALRRQAREAAALAEDEAAAATARAALAALPARNPAGRPIEALRAQRDRLAAVAASLAGGPRRDVETPPKLETPKPAPQAPEPASKPAAEPEIRFRHDTEIREDNSMNGSVAPARVEPSGVERVTPALAGLAAGPLMTDALRRGRPGWPGLTEAAAGLAPYFGIDPMRWRNACAELGRAATSLCVLIIERGVDRDGAEGAPPIERPSAYFDALVARGRRGELKLDRSIFALAKTPAAACQAALGRPIETYRNPAACA
jgi:replication initiation protein RepC